MEEEMTQEEMDRQDIEDAREALAEDGQNVPLRDFMHELGDCQEQVPDGDPPLVQALFEVKRSHWPSW